MIAKDLAKEESLWNVESIYEFHYFNCPSCSYKNVLKQNFVNHSFTNHPESANYLKKISDGSLYDIISPWESSYKGEDIETENFKNEINDNLELQVEDKWGMADNEKFDDHLIDDEPDYTMSEMKVENFPSEVFKEQQENVKSSGDKIGNYNYNNIGYGNSKTAANKRRCGKETISYHNSMKLKEYR